MSGRRDESIGGGNANGRKRGDRKDMTKQKREQMQI